MSSSDTAATAVPRMATALRWRSATHFHPPTNLQGETEAIGKLLERTMLQKYGPAELGQRFMVMDTICDATQVRGMLSIVQDTGCVAPRAPVAGRLCSWPVSGMCR